jgi:hypothetical protein
MNLMGMAKSSVDRLRGSRLGNILTLKK